MVRPFLNHCLKFLRLQQFRVQPAGFERGRVGGQLVVLAAGHGRAS